LALNAFLSLGKGQIELMQPTDPSSAVARFLKTHGEGVYLVSFEVEDISGSVKTLRERGAKVTLQSSDAPIAAWIHPRDAHGVFMGLLKSGVLD